jgi:hypothetical protein
MTLRVVPIGVLRRARQLGLAGWVLALVIAAPARSEPYLAVANGFKCSQCHVNPTGGGMRTPYGNVFAQTLLPAQHLDTGSDPWTGAINRYIGLGGDLRFDAQRTEVPNTQAVNAFQLQQARVYLEASPIPERLEVYIDEQVAPGGALNREAWVLYWSASHDWYLKGGQMYLPFGLRLQDQTAFILQTSGINMTTPDQGVEFGWLKGHWDAQLAFSNGTAGGAATANGKQSSAQLTWVESWWRLGAAANYNDAAQGGSRSAFALFAGLKTGPIAWLGQAELIDDRTGSGTSTGTSTGGTSASSTASSSGGVKEVATLVEGNWLFARGQNLKATAEYLDPNRSVKNNGQTRYSLVYELTPIQFVQFRAGVRYGDGIPQIATQHTRLYFIELHGFF